MYLFNNEWNVTLLSSDIKESYSEPIEKSKMKFCENASRLKLRPRCLTGFWIPFCISALKLDRIVNYECAKNLRFISLQL